MKKSMLAIYFTLFTTLGQWTVATVTAWADQPLPAYEICQNLQSAPSLPGGCKATCTEENIPGQSTKYTLTVQNASSQASAVIDESDMANSNIANGKITLTFNKPGSPATSLKVVAEQSAEKIDSLILDQISCNN